MTRFQVLEHVPAPVSFARKLIQIGVKPERVIFDDLDWSIAKSRSARKSIQRYAAYSEEDKKARQVREVRQVIVPARGYEHTLEDERFCWGIAQKLLRG